MRKFLIMALVAFFAFTAQSFAVPSAPALNKACGEAYTLFWNDSGSHTDHRIYRSIRSHPAQPYSSFSQVGNTTLHAWFEEPPQAQSTKYRVTNVDATGESSPSNEVQCDSDIKWIAGAETTPWATSGTNGEWATTSLVNGAAFTVTTPAVLKGNKAYQHQITAESSSEERAESSQGNASAANMTTNQLYENGATLWIAYAVYIPSSYAYCGTACSKDYDGGAITQEKQLGSCGNPVLSMATFNVPADGTRTISQNNSVENYCPSGSSPADSQILWKIPIQPDRWIKIIRRIHFDTATANGYIEAFFDNDGNTANNWTAVSTSYFTPDGLAKSHAPSVTELGTTERLYTHTQKTGAGTSTGVCDDSPPVGNWPCTHQRVGIYRSPDITGGSTIWHDGIAVGPTAAGVIQAAF